MEAFPERGSGKDRQNPQRGLSREGKECLKRLTFRYPYYMSNVRKSQEKITQNFRKLQFQENSQKRGPASVSRSSLICRK
jgi:hypothetical protein